MQVRAQQGDTIDDLCWRHQGTSAAVEATLELNPGIAALGVILPAGTLVTLPAQSDVPAQQTNLIQLWD